MVQVHQRVTPSIKFIDTHLYTRVQRGNKRVNCPAQEHKTMALARAQTQTPWSGDKHTNHEASVLTLWVAHKNITAAFYNREICCLLGSFLVEGSPECKILLKSYQGIFLWKQWCGIFSVSSKYEACSDETFFISGLALWKCGSWKLYAVRFSKNSREPFKTEQLSPRERLLLVTRLIIVMKILQSIPKSPNFITKEIFKF